MFAAKSATDEIVAILQYRLFQNLPDIRKLPKIGDNMTKRTLAVTLLGVLFVCKAALAAQSPQNVSPLRSFTFTYDATINGLQAGPPARIWLPIAQSSPDQ